MKSIYLFLVLALAVADVSAEHKHAKCEKDSDCANGVACHRLRVGRSAKVCIAQEHSLKYDDICFSDKECETERCYREFSCDNDKSPELKQICGGSKYGRCIRAKKSGGEAVSCYRDNECASNTCSGDVIFNKKKLRGVDEASGEINKGHCMRKSSRFGQVLDAFLLRILSKADETYKHVSNDDDVFLISL